MIELNLNGLETFFPGKNQEGKLVFGAFGGQITCAVYSSRNGKFDANMMISPVMLLAMKSILKFMITAGPNTVRTIKTSVRDKNDFKQLLDGPTLVFGRDENMMIYISLVPANKTTADAVKYYFKSPITLEIGESGDDKAKNIAALKVFVEEFIDKKAAVGMMYSAINGSGPEDIAKRMNNIITLYAQTGDYNMSFGAYNGFVSGTLWAGRGVSGPVSKMTLNNNIINAFGKAVDTIVKGDSNARMYIHKGSWDSESKKVVPGQSLTFGKTPEGICYMDFKDPSIPEPVRFKFSIPKTITLDSSFSEAEKSELAAIAFGKYSMSVLVYMYLMMSRDKASMSRYKGGGTNSSGSGQKPANSGYIQSTDDSDEPFGGDGGIDDDIQF